MHEVLSLSNLTRILKMNVGSHHFLCSILPFLGGVVSNCDKSKGLCVCVSNMETLCD